MRPLPPPVNSARQSKQERYGSVEEESELSKYVCVLILLYMCPHTAIFVSSYCCICFLILLCMCPHSAIFVSSNCCRCPHTAVYVSSYCCICVHILLYMCPHAAIYVSSYCYICVLIPRDTAEHIGKRLTICRAYRPICRAYR